MGGNKGMLKRLNEATQAGFDAGLDTGYQKAFDILNLVLQDPEVMGHDTFGAARLKKISEAAQKKELQYRAAWQHTQESDYLQEQLDRNLEKSYGEKLTPFPERYPYMKTWDYGKPEHKKQ